MKVHQRTGKSVEKLWAGPEKSPIPIPINNCPLRIRPADFEQGVGVQQWLFPFKYRERSAKPAGEFPSGEF